MIPGGLNVMMMGGLFDPGSLFAGSEFGAWYDPSDISTLWQDTAGTTAVTTSGQSVKRIDDKSGNGLHLTEATNPPTYTESGGLKYLDFDGTNDVLTSAAFTTALLVDGSIAVAAYADVAGSHRVISEYLASATINRIQLRLDCDVNTRLLVHNPGALSTEFVDLDSALSATTGYSLIVSGNGTTSTGYVNETAQTDTAAQNDSFAGGDRHILLGKQANAATFFDGRFYGGILLDREFSVQEISDIDKYLKDKAGI